MKCVGVGFYEFFFEVVDDSEDFFQLSLSKKPTCLISFFIFRMYLESTACVCSSSCKETSEIFRIVEFEFELLFKGLIKNKLFMKDINNPSERKNSVEYKIIKK